MNICQYSHLDCTIGILLRKKKKDKDKEKSRDKEKDKEKESEETEKGLFGLAFC